MIAHLSIPAREPLRVARVIAKLIDGELVNFPIVQGAVMAVARDGSGFGIEVWPETVTQYPGKGAPDEAAKGGPRLQPWDFQLDYASAPPRHNAVHVALTTRLGEAEIFALGEAEGWRCIATSRGGGFNLYELWLENQFMLEIIPQDELPRYQAFTQPEIVRQAFGPAPQ